MLDTIRDIIINYIDVDPSEITEETNLRADLGMSSLDLINIAVEIEDTFLVELPNSDMQNITNIGELMDVINEKKA